MGYCRSRQGDGGRSCPLDESDHNARHTGQHGALACQQRDADLPTDEPRRLFGAAAGSPSNGRRRTHRVTISSGQGACTGYVFTAPATFPARSSKLSSQSLRVRSKELLHTTQFQTTLYTKVSGTMRSLAGRCYYFSLKRSIGQHRWRLHTFRPRWQWIRLCP